MSELNHENVLLALKQIEKLRASTNYFWKMLSNGKNDQYPYRPNKKDLSNSENNNESTETADGVNNKEIENEEEENSQNTDKYNADKKEYLLKLKSNLKENSNIILEIEKAFSNLPNTPIPTPIIANTLLKDPLALQSNIAQHTIKTYKWFSKMHEQCLFASTYLSTHLTKRTTPSNTLLRRSRKATVGYNCPPSTIDQLVKQISHHLSDLHISLHKPFGFQLNSIILEIRVAQVLKAMVCLRGLCIESVIIKALDEDFLCPDSKKHDFNSSSRHEVFQMITGHAQCIMLFNSFNPDSTFKQFLMWLNSYRTLFSQPCSRCHKFLRSMVPPTWREYPSFEPTHLLCLRA